MDMILLSSSNERRRWLVQSDEIAFREDVSSKKVRADRVKLVDICAKFVDPVFPSYLNDYNAAIV